uniref:non-specific serine/threonine protein kinase n=1 Tax=Oryza glumipatula TaxID=40148 RepID=A0A0D9ZWC1_9ORYZ
MRRRNSSSGGGGFGGHLLWLVLVLWSWRIAAAQAQQAPKTDPIEVSALNTIMGRWGLTASSEWNISGEPCSGVASDKSDWDNYPKDPAIKCDCSSNNNTICHIIKLRVRKLNVVGRIPAELQNLTFLQDLGLGFNPLSGQLPKELGNLTNLLSLGISLDNFTGELPEELGNLTKLEQLYIDSSGFSGPFPSTISKLKNLKKASDNEFTGKLPDYLGSLTELEDLVLRNCRISENLETVDFSKNLVANNIVLGSTKNSDLSTRGSDNTIYEADAANLGDASYYVTDQIRWGVSNVGYFYQATDRMDIIYSSQHFQNAVDSKLFETARMSPSSLRYYGLGLENGNYTVMLQFAEFAFPDTQTWLSLGRRIFDIYVQGALKEKNFDIRKTAGGKSFTAINRTYTATVLKNFLEIHLFWAGKGTSGIPTQGYYGPMISALSVTPNFTPTVRNGVPKMGSKAGEIAGILTGASVLGLAGLFGIFMWIKKRRTMAKQKEELYNLVGRPDVFSNSELKLATDNFNSQNIIGEGGYGPVYKGKLPDGRVIAVKQLSESSHQGKSQFVTEVATISAVQHRNLVKLHGCCIDSNTPLLVYEYLENGSLDRAIFGHSSLNLDWAMRFEIILGIARGLSYLHEESSVCIVHRDIKASNILLDTDLIPKISDFGLAKLYDEKQTHVSTRIAGTFGYLAPEYAMRGHLTQKADVFAFGVVMLETVAGRSNTNNSLEESKINLLEWAWDQYEKEQALRILDPSLKGFNKDEAFRVIRVALHCTQGSPHQRPPMSKVVAMLTGEVEVPEVVTKPSYITEWQMMDGNRSYVTSSYSGSTTHEFSRQNEIEPLQQSPPIIKAGSSPVSSPAKRARPEKRQTRGDRSIAMRHSMAGVFTHLVWPLLVLVLCSWRIIAPAQAQPRTDPVEAAALNTILGRWGKTASPEWNISGELCSGVASDLSNWDDYPNLNPFIKCDCKYNNGTLCHINKLRVTKLDVVGPIPSELQNLTYLEDLNLGYNYLTGAMPSFMGKFTSMKYLALPFNPLSGPLPKELGNLTNLLSLGISYCNFSRELPDELGNMTSLKQLRASDNEFTGKIPDYFGRMTNLVDVAFQGNSFEGPIPAGFSNLTKLTNLRIGDIVNGSSSLGFISNMTSLSNLILRNCKLSGNLEAIDFSKFATLTLLDLSFNSITGQVPQSILNLGMLEFLFLGNNSLTGNLPDVISPSLKTIDFSYNQLTGSFPSWDNYSFAVDCGSNSSTRGSDNTIYEADPMNLGAGSYFVTGEKRWGMSNVGKFDQATNGMDIIYSSDHFQNTVDSKLFETARMSASSLRYYGLGLENGNYTVLLQFAEFAFPDSQGWQSLGKRVFDIYVQGALKEKDFNIKKTAGGKSFTVVNRNYTATVSKNFLEIHLFWAGKGTCCVPTQGYYGPMVSALSVTPNFTPTVRNGVPKRGNRAGVIAGVLIGSLVLGLATFFGIFIVVKKRRAMAQQKEELYNLVGRPDVFSNVELKLATDNFSSKNILGEGGYGPVYKGKLPDGRVIAVKQLSQSSHQGKSQFITEVTTISSVQHKNLVKLHGFCIDNNAPLLVYEYLENGSLDRALFTDNNLNLDWAMRFEIILGIARGITYLHEESNVRIVHRDIKASNVLLDMDLTPKISDFGLAKLYDEKQTHVSTRIAGTFGYLAPEYAMRGRLTEKVDIFAFGVVMLETVAGRSNTNNSLKESEIYLFEWAWDLYEKEQPLGIVDSSLMEYDKDEALRVIRVALLCTQGSPHQRPPMSKVVAMLTGEVEVAEVVTKPSYITEWQLRDGNRSYVTTSYSGSSTHEFNSKDEIKPFT